MSIGISTTSEVLPQIPDPIRVFGFIDGFNLYHALNKLERAANYSEETKYHQYKWLCLRTLIGQFVPPEERLDGVHYFTAYPNWPGSEQKQRRHETYVGALRSRGVIVKFGEFKPKETECRNCKAVFEAPVEKETDINIAISMIQNAEHYDKALLVTADSDQVAAIKLLRQLYPAKQYVSIAPIGRSAKALTKACGRRFVMTEQHLIDSQLPSPLPVVVNGKETGLYYVKPNNWTLKVATEASALAPLRSS